jgi:hypothetical protein
LSAAISPYAGRPLAGFIRLKISELITLTLPRWPITAGTSKVSMPTIISSVVTESRAGTRNGNETRRRV